MLTRPRDWLVAPGFFGERTDALWKSHLTSQHSDVAMAYLQHRVALLSEDFSATATGRPKILRWSSATIPRRRGRKLKGHLRMSLEDLIRLILEFGVDVLPPLQDRAELLPPDELLSR